MNLQQRKEKIIQQLAMLNDEALIEVIQKMLQYGLENQHERISVEQYNKELQMAEDGIVAGKGISHAQLKSEMKKW